MPEYTIRCEHALGDFEETKFITADTVEEAVQYLQDQGYTVYDIEEQADED